MSSFLADNTDIAQQLSIMEDDPTLVTESTYRANTLLWPDNRISFVDTHMAYLKAHPNMEPKHYLSNLRLMLRINS